MPPPSDPTRPPPPQALLGPLARLLRPLVRLLIRSGVTFPVLADLLRGLYVEVAVRDLLTDPKARTDSRVSLLTGVHRKEIRRLRTEPATPQDTPPAVVTMSSQIIARWLGTPPYADGEGRPRPLPRAATAADEPSFEGLVASVTKDVRGRAVLDDWAEQGIVTLDDQGRVTLNAAAYVPRPGSEAQLFYFARNLHDHIAAAADNVAGGTVRFLDRSVHYDGLQPETAARIEAAARQSAQQLLLEINRVALPLAEADDAAGDAPATPLRRINLGVYLYAEDDTADEEPSE